MSDWFQSENTPPPIDDSWLKGEPLGRVIGNMRSRGTHYRPEWTNPVTGRVSPAGYYSVAFVPDLHDKSKRYEVCTGWSNRETPEGPNRDFVMIIEWDGIERVMQTEELARYRARGHWQWIYESPADRKAAMELGKANFEALALQVKTL